MFKQPRYSVTERKSHNKVQAVLILSNPSSTDIIVGVGDSGGNATGMYICM